MILSLTLATLIFIPLIAIIGISEIGETAIGAEGTATYYANATLWNTYASIGSPVIILIISLSAFVFLLLILFVNKGFGE